VFGADAGRAAEIGDGARLSECGHARGRRGPCGGRPFRACARRHRRARRRCGGRARASEELERRCALMRAKYAQSQNTTGPGVVRLRPPVTATEPLSSSIAATDELPIHPLVGTTQKLVRGQKAASDGILCAAHLRGVDVDVSPALWSRALMLLNRLFREISARGWTIGLSEHRREVSIGKHRIPIRLREALTTMAMVSRHIPATGIRFQCHGNEVTNHSSHPGGLSPVPISWKPSACRRSQPTLGIPNCFGGATTLGSDRSGG
jgi:hypothetical protein